MDKLRRYRIVEAIFQLPLVSTILTTLLPSLVLRIFLIIAPIVLRVLCRWQGMICQSQVEFGVVRKYFTFQVRATISRLFFLD